MTNVTNRVLYTGVTNNLYARVLQHKQGATDCFTKKYNVNKLVYFEKFNDIRDAIAREKQIKGGGREKKLILIERINPGWCDLSYEI